MKFLFPKEKLLFDLIAGKNPEGAAILKKAFEKIWVHLPEKLLHEKYNPKVTEEFLRKLATESQRLGLEDYMAVVTEDETAHTLGEKCLGAKNLEKNIMKSLGSYGLTRLIGDVMKKMTEEKFTKKDAENLADIIQARNKMRQNEQDFLETVFQSYLESQLSLYL